MKSGQFLLILFSLMFGNINAQEQNFTEIDKEAFPTNMDIVLKKIRYPSQLKKEKIEGRVLAKVLVDPQGKIQKHEILESPHSELSKAVSSEIYQLKFVPAESNGKKIACWVVIPFEFICNLEQLDN